MEDITAKDGPRIGVRLAMVDGVPSLRQNGRPRGVSEAPSGVAIELMQMK
jgi:hypothetical protein